MSSLVSAKHEKFCIGIAEGLTAEMAYIEAGYSPNGAAQSASRLLRNAEIQTRIEVLRNTMAEHAIDRAALTRSYVIERLMTIVEQCSQLEPIRDRYGTVVGYCGYKPMAAIRALLLLGKELGMFTGRHERPPITEYNTIEEMQQRRAELEKRLVELNQQDEELDRLPKRKRLGKDGGTLH